MLREAITSKAVVHLSSYIQEVIMAHAFCLDLHVTKFDSHDEQLHDSVML